MPRSFAARHHLIEQLAEDQVLALQISQCQLFFGREVSIQAGLVRSGFFEDLIDPRVGVALAREQRFGGAQNAIAWSFIL